MAGIEMGQLMQMIVGLGQLKNDRRRMELTEKELMERSKQFASTERRSDFIHAIELMAKASPEARAGMLPTLRETLAPEYQASLDAWATKQPTAMQTQRESAMEQGTANATPDQLAAMQGEAAAVGLTGMNRGDVGTSGVIAALANPGGVTPQQQTGYAQRLATGETPVAAAVGQSTIDQGIVPRVARIQGGTEMSAPAAAANAIAGRHAAVAERGMLVTEGAALREADIQAWEMEMRRYKAKLEAEGAGQAAMTPAERAELMDKVRQLAQWAGDPKTPQATREWATSMINFTLQGTGMPGVTESLDPMNSLMRNLRSGNPSTPFQMMPTSPFSGAGAAPRDTTNPVGRAGAMHWLRP